MTCDIKLLLNQSKLVDPSKFSKLWKGIAKLYHLHSGNSVGQVLQDVLNSKTEFDQLTDCDRIDHLAFYIGDYESDMKIFQLVDYFSQLKSVGQLQFFEFGASCLAPLYYDTQGWWFSLEGIDGVKVELFSFKDFGQWQSYSIDSKIDLISHYAVLVPEKEDLKKILDLYSSKSHLRQISYTDDDKLGHTYGHILNMNNNRMIEFIHQNQQHF